MRNAKWGRAWRFLGRVIGAVAGEQDRVEAGRVLLERVSSDGVAIGPLATP